MNEEKLEELYNTMNELIKEDVIRFNYYNTDRNLDLLQCMLNKSDNTIEISFRDNMSEMVQELKKIMDNK